jgi:hypothetical protein
MNFKSVLGVAAAVAGTIAINAPAQASTAVAFNNFDVGDGSNCCIGWTISGAGSPVGRWDQAMGFDSAVRGSVSEIDLALSQLTGSGDAQVSLWTDVNGGLGKELGHWNVTATQGFGSNGVVLSIPGITGVHVHAGSSYFLLASGSEGVWDAWNWNTIGSSGPLWENGSNVGSNTLGAFRVLANAPEPATWAMMLIGFGAVGAAARGRRGAAALAA